MATLKIAWNWRERLARGERGAELIEFALVLPLLLLLVLGIVDFAFMFQRLEVVTNAAREGARIAVLAGYDTPDVRARVNSYLVQGGVPISPGNPVVNLNTVPLASPGGTITAKQVQVTYNHTYMFLSGVASWFGGNFSNVPLNAVSTMRAEGGGS
jgi:hypothetical protein